MRYYDCGENDVMGRVYSEQGFIIFPSTAQERIGTIFQIAAEPDGELVRFAQPFAIVDVATRAEYEAQGERSRSIDSEMPYDLADYPFYYKAVTE